MDNKFVNSIRSSNRKKGQSCHARASCPVVVILFFN